MTTETKRSANFTDEEKEIILAAVEARPFPQSIAARCKELEVSEGTVTRWMSNKRIGGKPTVFKSKIEVAKMKRPERVPLPAKFNW